MNHHHRYPDKELRITGILFGSLIQHQLVSSITLGIALRWVLDALRKPPGTKMFQFGMTALQQFQHRLHEWPQYCQHIMQIPHLGMAHPDLVSFMSLRFTVYVPPLHCLMFLLTVYVNLGEFH
jgi:CCR4-NOT transcription complex subunit 1